MVEEKKLSEEEKKDIEENKLLAAVSYIWILCLIPLFLRRKSKFAQFHAKQGLILFIAEVLGFLVFWIPIIGLLIALGILVLAVMGIYNAILGKYWEMPFLGKYAKKINL